MANHHTKLCPRCNLEKSIYDFYRRRSGKDTSSYCKKCSSDQVTERQRLFKRKCIEYKGGSCQSCSYNKCDAALEFHHKDPKQKDFHLSKFRHYGKQKDELLSIVKEELDKCMLLCSNFHREEHDRLSR